MELSRNPERQRLVWRCRRGMKELDLLLTGYLHDSWDAARPEEKAAFERILELPDPVLAAYLLQRDVAPDPTMQALVATLRERTGRRLPEAPAAGAPSRHQQS